MSPMLGLYRNARAAVKGENKNPEPFLAGALEECELVSNYVARDPAQADVKNKRIQILKETVEGFLKTIPSDTWEYEHIMPRLQDIINHPVFPPQVHDDLLKSFDSAFVGFLRAHPNKALKKIKSRSDKPAIYIHLDQIALPHIEAVARRVQLPLLMKTLARMYSGQKGKDQDTVLKLLNQNMLRANKATEGSFFVYDRHENPLRPLIMARETPKSHKLQLLALWEGYIGRAMDDLKRDRSPVVLAPGEYLHIDYHMRDLPVAQAIADILENTVRGDGEKDKDIERLRSARRLFNKHFDDLVRLTPREAVELGLSFPYETYLHKRKGGNAFNREALALRADAEDRFVAAGLLKVNFSDRHGDRNAIQTAIHFARYAENPATRLKAADVVVGLIPNKAAAGDFCGALRDTFNVFGHAHKKDQPVLLRNAASYARELAKTQPGEAVDQLFAIAAKAENIPRLRKDIVSTVIDICEGMKAEKPTEALAKLEKAASRGLLKGTAIEKASDVTSAIETPQPPLKNERAAHRRFMKWVEAHGSTAG